MKQCDKRDVYEELILTHVRILPVNSDICVLILTLILCANIDIHCSILVVSMYLCEYIM